MKKILLSASLLMVSASSFAATGVWHDSGVYEIEAEFDEAASVNLVLNHSTSLATDNVGTGETLAVLTATSPVAGTIGFHWLTPKEGKPSSSEFSNQNGTNIEVEFRDESNRSLVPSAQNDWFTLQGATNTATKAVVQIRPAIDNQPVTPGSYSGTLEAARYVE